MPVTKEHDEIKSLFQILTGAQQLLNTVICSKTMEFTIPQRQLLDIISAQDDLKQQKEKDSFVLAIALSQSSPLFCFLAK